MKALVLSVCMLAGATNALAAQVENINLGERLVKIQMKLDEASISSKDDSGLDHPGQICHVNVIAEDLMNHVLLAPLGRHQTFGISAGRWCAIKPVEPFLEAMRASGGTIAASAVIRLSESRYEVTNGHGEPENVGKCNRNLQETVIITMPNQRTVSYSVEKRLETTSLENCFR